MVRFSDLLGGSGEPDDARAANSPFAALKSDEPEPEPEAEPASEPEPDVESPEAVLSRLTQYATAKRAAAPASPPEPVEPVEPVEPEDEPPDEPLPPVGDDF